MKFYINSVADLKQVENYINGYNRKNEGFSVEVKAVKDARSLAQNAMWWTLVTAVARQSGDFKESTAVTIKKAYMKENNLSEWIDTHKLDVADMSKIIDYAFHFLMNVAEGYLDETEGTQWIKYNQSRG